MMSLGEWITVLIVVGAASGVCLFAVIYLIKQAMKQSAEAAVAKKEAKDNAIAVHKLERAAEILLEPADVDDTIRKLRGGKF